jgi:hypothetical protein
MLWESAWSAIPRKPTVGSFPITPRSLHFITENPAQFRAERVSNKRPKPPGSLRTNEPPSLWVSCSGLLTSSPRVSASVPVSIRSSWHLTEPQPSDRLLGSSLPHPRAGRRRLELHLSPLGEEKLKMRKTQSNVHACRKSMFTIQGSAEDTGLQGAINTFARSAETRLDAWYCCLFLHALLANHG